MIALALLAASASGAMTLNCSLAAAAPNGAGVAVNDGVVTMHKVVIPLPGTLRFTRAGDRWPRGNFSGFDDRDGVTGGWTMVGVDGMATGAPALTSAAPGGGAATLTTMKAEEAVVTRLSAKLKRRGFAGAANADYVGNCVVLPGMYKVER